MNSEAIIIYMYIYVHACKYFAIVQSEYTTEDQRKIEEHSYKKRTAHVVIICSLMKNTLNQVIIMAFHFFFLLML